MPAVDVDLVAAFVHEAAASVVLPAWRSLTRADVEEKSPGEVVTFVDRQAEAFLSERLQAALPGAVVVGEEASAADPSLLGAVEHAPLVWLVDPLDGTHNFVNGSEDFAVMVALVEQGETVASWIERPAVGRSYTAVRGAGAFASGKRLTVDPSRSLSSLRGAALTRFLDAGQRAAVARLAETVGAVGPGRLCAGVDYSLIADGEQDFVFFWRTLPWDHAPGALLVTETGGTVAHLDGTAYRPSAPRQGLVAAADPAAHAAVRVALAPVIKAD